VLQFNAKREDATLNATSMQPIGVVWNKLPRLVRELAHSRGKQVRLEMERPDTELDKTLIEAIKDPITHLVRNCCDHGIEPPPARAQAGKNSQGLVCFNCAAHASTVYQSFGGAARCDEPAARGGSDGWRVSEKGDGLCCPGRFSSDGRSDGGRN
jgi:two-component system chemotaxis sensor kinase CheA